MKGLMLFLSTTFYLEVTLDCLSLRLRQNILTHRYYGITANITEVYDKSSSTTHSVLELFNLLWYEEFFFKLGILYYYVTQRNSELIRSVCHYVVLMPARKSLCMSACMYVYHEVRADRFY